MSDLIFGSIGIISLFVYLLLIYAGTFVYAVLAYIFGARAYFAMARLRGIKAPWLAWIPGASMWLMGSIADHYDNVRTGSNRQLRKVYIGVTIGAIMLTIIASAAYSIIVTYFAVAGNAAIEQTVIIGTLIYFAVLLLLLVPAVVTEYIIYYKIYASCAPNRAKGLLVLSIFFPVIIPFVMFGLRSRTDGLIPEVPEQAE